MQGIAIHCPRDNRFSEIYQEILRGKRDTTRNISCSISFSCAVRVTYIWITLWAVHSKQTNKQTNIGGLFTVLIILFFFINLCSIHLVVCIKPLSILLRSSVSLKCGPPVSHKCGPTGAYMERCLKPKRLLVFLILFNFIHLFNNRSPNFGGPYMTQYSGERVNLYVFRSVFF